MMQLAMRRTNIQGKLTDRCNVYAYAHMYSIMYVYICM